MSVELPTTGSGPWHWKLADACERRADELRLERLRLAATSGYAREELVRREGAARDRAEEHRSLAREADARARRADPSAPGGPPLASAS